VSDRLLYLYDLFFMFLVSRLDIDVPERVMERRLLGLVRDLEKEREEYLNQEALVKKQTDILANQFRNNATQSVAFSDAQAQLAREQAKANALKIVEIARIDGFVSMCQRLGIQNSKERSSLQYLRTLRDSSDNIKYSIDFTHAVVQQQKLPAITGNK
jgi:FKBP-type peptidyl-prolyl cis-trans isomerase (trigger factor)